MEAKVRAKLIKMGAGRGVEIPAAFIEQAGLDDELELTFSAGSIMIANRRRDADRLRHQGRGDEATAGYEQAARAHEAAGRLDEAGECWHMLGVAVHDSPAKAMPAYEEALRCYRAAGSLVGVGRVYRDIGIMHLNNGRLAEALDWFAKSEHQLRATPAPAELGITLVKAGHALQLSGRPDEGEQKMQAGLADIRRQGQSFYEATALMHLAELELERSNPAALVTYSWAALGALWQEHPEFSQAQLIEHYSRRAAELFGLLAHGYLGLGNRAAAVAYLDRARPLVDAMSPDTAQLVRRKVRLDELESSLAKPYSEAEF